MEKMIEYYLPEYVHLYNCDSKYFCLFHAITQETIYCRKDKVFVDNGIIFTEASIANVLLKYGIVVKEKEEAEKAINLNIDKYRESSNKNQIRFLYIVPTVACNLHCTYCHIQHGKYEHHSCTMDEHTLKKGLDIFMKYGGFDGNNSEIMFYGGEPFLESDFLINALHIIRNYSNEVKITIFTNGTLVSKEIAEKLKEFDVYVIVSIDGKKKSQDKARIYHDGLGSYEDAIRGYKILQEQRIAVGISLVAGTHNIETLEQDVLYLAEKFNPMDIGISTLHLFKDAKNPNEITMEKMTEKLHLVQVQMREKGVYIEHIFRKMRPFVEKSTRIYDCPSCNSKLLITPWNTIGFCEAFMEEGSYYYDIDTFDLMNCVGREDWKNRIPLTKRECYACPAISICGGGCPYDAYCESGSVCNKDERRCMQSKDMIEWLVKELFNLLIEKGNFSDEIYIPNNSERKLLYGRIALNKDIPLQNYSKMNEL